MSTVVLILDTTVLVWGSEKKEVQMASTSVGHPDHLSGTRVIILSRDMFNDVVKRRVTVGSPDNASFGPNNFALDLTAKSCAIMPTPDWQLTNNQPFRLTILEELTSGSFVIRMTANSEHPHEQVLLDLPKLVEAMESSSSVIIHKL